MSYIVKGHIVVLYMTEVDPGTVVAVIVWSLDL
jgi:hypothetical protein